MTSTAALPDDPQNNAGLGSGDYRAPTERTTATPLAFNCLTNRSAATLARCSTPVRRAFPRLVESHSVGNSVGNLVGYRHQQPTAAQHHRLRLWQQEITVFEDSSHCLVDDSLGKRWLHATTNAAGLGRRLHPGLASLINRDDDELPHEARNLEVNGVGLPHSTTLFLYCFHCKAPAAICPARISLLGKATLP